MPSFPTLDSLFGAGAFERLDAALRQILPPGRTDESFRPGAVRVSRAWDDGSLLIDFTGERAHFALLTTTCSSVPKQREPAQTAPTAQAVAATASALFREWGVKEITASPPDEESATTLLLHCPFVRENDLLIWRL